MARTKSTSTNGSASKKTTTRKNATASTPKTKILDADKVNTTGFSSERKQMQSINFAKMQEILQRNVTRNINLTFTQYTKSLIQAYLQNPASNVENIRAVSRFLCRYSMLYQKIIMYLASMPLFHYNITPINDFDKEIDAEAGLKKFYTVLSEFNKFNIKKELYNVLYLAIRDGIYIGYMFDKKDGAEKRFLMMLDPSYVRILGKNESGEWVAYFNAAYFDASTNKEFIEGLGGSIEASAWPQVFIDAYRIYKEKGRDYQWFRLPPEKVLVLTVGSEDDFTYPLPFFAPLFISLLDLIDLEQIIQNKTVLENYKLIVSKIPLSEKGNSDVVDDFAISAELAEFFNNLLTSVVPEQIGVVYSPMDIDTVDFDKSNSSDDTDTLANAIRNLFNNSGISEVVVAGGGANPSTLAIKYSQINDRDTVWVWVNRLETWFNYYIKKNISDGYLFEIFKLTDYNKEEFVAEKKDMATLGGSALDMASAIDGSPFRVMNKLRFENAIGLKELFVPLQSSYTLSGDEERGRPTVADDEISESGDRSRNR